MIERPILFSAPMVRALLAGTKTQTRRVLKADVPPGAQRVIRPFADERLQWAATDPHDMEQGQLLLGDAPRCPYGQPGDRLWVRENLAYDSERGHYYAATELGTLGNPSGRTYVDYDNETPATGLPARSIPSIHMPRWASRITLEVTGVRVERLQDISATDCWAEGIEEIRSAGDEHGDLRGSVVEDYQALWEDINGPGSWDANPWVWVVEFRRLP
ncbi:hypothetical protein [Hydrogenophaga crocea]